MDLSDGSDAEGGDYELDENALLGSDDEDGAHYSRAPFVPDGIGYEEHDEDHIGHGEDGDVLDLELHDDDGLEFADEPDGCSSIHARVAPVRVAAISNTSEKGPSEPNTDSYQHQIPDNYEDYDNEYDEDHSHAVLEDEDDDDEESRNTRTRFHNERNPNNFSKGNNASIQPNFGNPIQTLGSGKPPMMTDDNRQRNWGRQNQNQGHLQNQNHHQGPRPRFHGMRNPLLGDRPHLNQNFNQFRPRGPRMNMNGPGGPPIPHGRMFAPNFNNQPPRIPNPHCPPQMREPGPPPFPSQGGGPPRRPMHDPSMQHMQLQGPHPNVNMNSQQPRHNNPRMQMRQQRPQQRPSRGGGPNNMSRHPNPNNNGWRNQRPQGPPFQRMPMNPHQGQPNNMNFMNGPPGPHMFPQDPGNMFLDQQCIQHPEIPGMQFNVFANMQMQQQMHQQPFPPQPVGFPGGGNISVGVALMGPPEMHPQQNVPQQQNPFFEQQQPLQPQPQFALQQQQLTPNPWPEPQQPPPNSWTGPPTGLQPPNFNLPQSIEIQAGQNGSFILSQQISEQAVHIMSRSIEETASTSTYPRSSFERNAELYQKRELESRSHHGQDRHASRIDHESVRHERRGSPPERRSSPHERRSYEDRSSYHDDDRRGYSRNDDRYPPKRKYDRDSSPYGNPEKSQRSRTDRPSSPPPRDRKADELYKIREEAKKTIGLDDDYIRKLEAQKRLREEILAKKAASRRKLTGADEPDTVSSSSQEKVAPKSAGRPSIYINPKAFRGDLSALKLKNIEQGTLKTTQIMHTNVAGVTTKPRKVLKIVKDKYGNILSKSKVIVVPRLQPDARTTPA